jgi:hypothetical protein
MEIDSLSIALLALCTPGRTHLHRVHGELEHWLNRPLATEEVAGALAQLESYGLVAVDREASELAFLATEHGASIAVARWEEFFPE